MSERYWNGPDGPAKLCRFCDCPMKPKGVKKRPNEYDHAQGCPYSTKRKLIQAATEPLIRENQRISRSAR